MGVSMTDIPSRSWLPVTTSECPVAKDKQYWIESSLEWFARQFGSGVLYRDVVLPTASFLPGTDYSATPDQVEELILQVCGLMMVDPGRIRLDLFDGSAEKKTAALYGRSRTVGHFHMDGGRAVIAVDQSESSDPLKVVAIAAHELSHYRLLGEKRIRRDRKDGERLTDLLTVYFGLGIFSTNAAMSFARAKRDWVVIPTDMLDDHTLNGAARHTGYQRLGYLGSAEFGYALACYSWVRHEADPGWARYVNPGPLVSLAQGLAYLARTSREGWLPVQLGLVLPQPDRPRVP
jgi:hypothetical protein